MPIVTGVANTWNLPNYHGELFTASAEETPLLSMTGGLTGGLRTDNFQFVTAQLYAHPDAAQPTISETASVTAPSPTAISREQEFNVVQIHQERVQMTYAKRSNSGRLSGINTANKSANPADDFNWQLQQKLIKIARDVEYSFIRGTYQMSTNASVANTTRGMLEVTKLANGTNINNATPAALTMTMLNNLYRVMADSGATFTNMVLFASATKVQQITALYNALNGFALPSTRTVGGIAIKEIVFDFGNLGIVWNRFMPNDAVLLVDVNYVAPVFQEVPGKGVLFTEPLAKTGATDDEQLYGQIGLDHGPAFMHGSITGLL